MPNNAMLITSMKAHHHAIEQLLLHTPTIASCKYSTFSGPQARPINAPDTPEGMHLVCSIIHRTNQIPGNYMHMLYVSISLLHLLTFNMCQAFTSCV